MLEEAPSATHEKVPICVIGAGTMGRGIAQVAIAAGHAVSLVDPDEGQLRAAADEMVSRLGRKNPDAAQIIEARLSVTGSIAEAAAHPGTIVVEAVVENLDVKHAVFTDALAHFGPGCILATNTSSLSITEIAAGVAEPSRVVGMHFFNPVPAMRLVEVVAGVQTDPAVVDTISALAKSWGKSVAQVRSAPGFIVNRVARGFYGEALKLVEEQATSLQVVDELMRCAGGFRMGPFELMDLIGNDVNYAVTRSVWTAYHYDPRFQPSLMQRELVASGRFGRKTGVGFYSYDSDRPSPTPEKAVAACPTDVVLRGESPQLDALLERAGVSLSRKDPEGEPSAEVPGLGTIVVTSGRTAQEESRLRGEPVLVLDRCLDPTAATALAFASDDMDLAAAVVAMLDRAGVRGFPVSDTPGLVVARVVSMIINEAWETAHHGVAWPEDIDTAMVHGTNYPLGPFAWCERWTPQSVLDLLDAVWTEYRDPRYRASRLLRMAVAAAQD